jgi:hypothetical protein
LIYVNENRIFKISALNKNQKLEAVVVWLIASAVGVLKGSSVAKKLDPFLAKRTTTTVSPAEKSLSSLSGSTMM